MTGTTSIVTDECVVKGNVLILDDVTTVFFEWMLGSEEGQYVSTEDGLKIKV